MKHLVSGLSGLTLGAAVLGLAGCAGDEDHQREHTSPMYRSESAPPEAPSNLTQTCAYKAGPLAGQTIDYSGTHGVSAVRVGNRCADMHGSSGWAVAQQPGAQQPQREQGGRFYTSPGAPNAWGPAGNLNPRFSLYCRFNSGPSAGHTADYSSTLGARPAVIGTACSDGPNQGVAVARGG